MAELLMGAAVANALTQTLAVRVEQLKGKGLAPTLAILRVGEQPADISYEAGAVGRCNKVGIAVKHFRFPADCPKERLLETIRTINASKTIHGCLMFRPIPDKRAEEEARSLLALEKDMDCMTWGSLASVFAGKGAGYPPCTAQACMEILNYYGIALQGKRVTVIGRSLVVGKPVSMMLQAQNATVTMCHTKTANMSSACRSAEIIVAAAGKAGMITAADVCPGQVIIDVGINVGGDGKLCGDVDFGAVEPIVNAITPVPGGVGSVTTAVLCKHVVEAAETSQ